MLAKVVPDTWAERRLDPATGLVVRAGVEHVLDEIGERALELAVAHAATNRDTRVSVIVMAPGADEVVVRRALAAGADDALHIADEALVGADYSLTAEVLAAAIRREPFDLVLTGSLSTDGGGGVIPAMLAELLGVACLTALASVEISDGDVSGQRTTEAGTATVAAALPAVVSITEALPEARLPGFTAILAAKKKPLTTVTAAELGVDAADPGVPRSIVLAVRERPARDAGVRIVDDGTAGEQLAEYLIANRLVEGR